jgi:nicotinamidase-related amidase
MSALILVDVQNDFLPPTGTLAVPGGHLIIAPVLRLLSRPFDLVVASQVCLDRPGLLTRGGIRVADHLGR